MQNKKISDKEITAPYWLHYKIKPGIHYAPNLARLNMISPSGGWCSESIDDIPNQYLQIDILKNKKVTGIATQGRAVAQEYVEKYQITYQRNNENFFRMYNESGEWKVCNIPPFLATRPKKLLSWARSWNIYNWLKSLWSMSQMLMFP